MKAAPQPHPRLETLTLRYCGRGLTPAACRSLAHCPLPSLTHLTLGDAFKLDDAGLQTVLAAAPNLHSLALPSCSYLTGAALEAVGKLAHLRTLEVAHCRGVSRDELRDTLPRLRELEKLSLAGCTAVDN